MNNKLFKKWKSGQKSVQDKMTYKLNKSTLIGVYHKQPNFCIVLKA